MPDCRILIADDHEIFRAGLRHAINDLPGFAVVGEAASGAEAIAQCERLSPDLLVLDVQMPPMTGMQVVEALHARGLYPRVLVLSAFEMPPYVEAMQRLGVRGYVPKSRPPSMIQTAIQVVAQGGSTWFVTPPSNPLTDREREVIVQLALGLSNEDIARALRISEATVRNMLTQIYQKIDVTNARAAVAWAWANGIATPTS